MDEAGIEAGAGRSGGNPVTRWAADVECSASAFALSALIQFNAIESNRNQSESNVLVFSDWPSMDENYYFSLVEGLLWNCSENDLRLKLL